MGLSKPLYNDMLALQQELVEKVQEMPEEELDKLKMDWSRALDRIALKRRKTERVVVQKGEDEVWSIEDYMKKSEVQRSYARTERARPPQRQWDCQLLGPSSGAKEDQTTNSFRRCP